MDLMSMTIRLYLKLESFSAWKNLRRLLWLRLLRWSSCCWSTSTSSNRIRLTATGICLVFHTPWKTTANLPLPNGWLRPISILSVSKGRENRPSDSDRTCWLPKKWWQAQRKIAGISSTHRILNICFWLWPHPQTIVITFVVGCFFFWFPVSI